MRAAYNSRAAATKGGLCKWVGFAGVPNLSLTVGGVGGDSLAHSPKCTFSHSCWGVYSMSHSGTFDSALKSHANDDLCPAHCLFACHCINTTYT